MKKYSAFTLFFIILFALITPAMAAEPEFSDVPSDHWALSDIQLLVERGAVTGMGDGTFAPESPVSAAHFTTMIAKLCYAEEFENAVNHTEYWWGKSMQIAQLAGLLYNTPVGDTYTVDADAESWDVTLTEGAMNRYEMAQMIYNLLSTLGVPLPAYPDLEYVRASIADNDLIPEKYRIATITSYVLGCLSGTDEIGTFNGAANMTRAQACKVLGNVIRIMETLPDPVKPEPQIEIEILLSQTQAKLELGDTFILSGEIITNGELPAKSWSSDNEAVATITSSGLISAVGSGTANITLTVTCEDVTETAVCVVTVAKADELTTMRYEVLRLVNIARAEEGLPALKLHDGACRAAQIRAAEIAEVFQHVRPDGESCFTTLKEVGVSYTTAGENIAAGYETPAAVVEAWLNSPGHRKNIMSTNFTHIGIGFVVIDGSYYGDHWVQMFIG